MTVHKGMIRSFSEQYSKTAKKKKKKKSFFVNVFLIVLLVFHSIVNISLYSIMENDQALVGGTHEKDNKSRRRHFPEKYLI